MSKDKIYEKLDNIRNIEVNLTPSGCLSDSSYDDKRKAIPVYSGFIKYFPNAIREISKCSVAGNNQHHADKHLHWDKSKSKQELDSAMRHLLDHAEGIIYDEDDVRHLAKTGWRVLAMLERTLTNQF